MAYFLFGTTLPKYSNIFIIINIIPKSAFPGLVLNHILFNTKLQVQFRLIHQLIKSIYAYYLTAFIILKVTSLQYFVTIGKQLVIHSDL